VHDFARQLGSPFPLLARPGDWLVDNKLFLWITQSE
jgi:hypothetical protein